MPNHPGFTVNWDTAKRIGRLVRDFEAGKLGAKTHEVVGYDFASGPPTYYVTVGDRVAGWPDGFHSGTLEFADPYTGDFYESTEAVMVYDLNGKDLKAGSRYTANYHEVVIDGAGNETAVFAVGQGGGGGAGAGGGAIVLQLGPKEAGTAYHTAIQCSHDGTMWQCGTLPGQITAAFALDVNGLDLEVGRRYVGIYCGEHDKKPVFGIQTWWNTLTHVNCDNGVFTEIRREINTNDALNTILRVETEFAYGDPPTNTPILWE